MTNRDTSDTALELFHRAYRLQINGDYDGARKLYQKSIELNPTPEAHTFLGWTYSFLGNYNQAINECKKAIALDPDFGNPYNDIGSYLIQLGRMSEAISWLEHAIRAKRYQARHYPHVNLARIYELQGKWFEAIEEYKAALHELPDYQLAVESINRLRSWMN